MTMKTTHVAIRVLASAVTAVAVSRCAPETFTFGSGVDSGGPDATRDTTAESAPPDAFADTATSDAVSEDGAPIDKGYKTVFITADTYDGTMGGKFGSAGADMACQTEAALAGLSGTFRAWLSTSTSDAASRFTHATEPYRLVNGTQVASNWTSLSSGSLEAAITVTETGAGSSAFNAWTATNPDGTFDNQYGVQGDCDDFTSTASAYSGLEGVISYTTSYWTKNGASSCNSFLPVYCFEQ